MKIEVTYIISQIFVVINYALLMVSYHLKSRTRILMANFAALIANAVAFMLLGGFSGVAMSLIAIIRNIIFLIDENKNGLSNKITKNDVFILLLIYFLTILFTIITYDNFGSLMVVLATMLYTYSVWQKSTKIYKILGIPVGILSLIYNIYMKSILGIILESFLTISATLGFIRENKK